MISAKNAALVVALQDAGKQPFLRRAANIPEKGDGADGRAWRRANISAHSTKVELLDFDRHKFLQLPKMRIMDIRLQS